MKPLYTLLITAFSLSATAGLTELDLVQAGLNNPLIQARFEAQLNAARGEKKSAGRWENPSIEYSRESLSLTEGSGEETSIWIKQDLNLAGVKGLERKAAEFKFQAQQYQLEIEKQDWQRLLRQNYYLTLAAEEKHVAVAQMLSRMQLISKMVKQRADKGDASRFDAMRIDKELALVLNQSTQASTNFLSLRLKLFNLLDMPEQKLSGTLLPSSFITENALDSEPPQVQALKSAQKSAETKVKAASRQAWPELSIGVGRKEVNEPDLINDGNLFSIEIEIPLFNQNRGEKQIALSRARALQAELALQQKKLHVDYLSTLNTYRSYRSTALELQKLSTTKQASLSPLAEASYQAGELSVTELLDAYQSDLAVAEQFIDSALIARKAYIQLQFLRGE